MASVHHDMAELNHPRHNVWTRAKTFESSLNMAKSKPVSLHTFASERDQICTEIILLLTTPILNARFIVLDYL